MLKKCLAILLALICIGAVCAAAAETPTTGELIRFIPTIITVKSDSVKVEGYFVNLNTDKAVKNFREFDMDVYLDGDKLLTGDFGTINEFEIQPLGVKYQSFTFRGSHDLNEGEYACDDHFYCTFGCKFTSTKK